MIYILDGGDHGFKYRVRDFVPGRQNMFFENDLILIIRSANLSVAPPIYFSGIDKGSKKQKCLLLIYTGKKLIFLLEDMAAEW